MAQILASDMNTLYATINIVRTRVGLPAIAVPSIIQGQPVKAEAGAIITEQLNSLKPDTYFKWAKYTHLTDMPVKGQVIAPNFLKGLQDTIGDISQVIQCRNTVNNANGFSRTITYPSTTTHSVNSVTAHSDNTKDSNQTYNSISAQADTERAIFFAESGYANTMPISMAGCDNCSPGGNSRGSFSESNNSAGCAQNTIGSDSKASSGGQSNTKNACPDNSQNNVCSDNGNHGNYGNYGDYSDYSQCPRNGRYTGNSVATANSNNSKTTQTTYTKTTDTICAEATNSNLPAIDVSNARTTNSNTASNGRTYRAEGADKVSTD